MYRYFTVILLMLSMITAASAATKADENATRAYEWLKRQQQPSGILGNQEADNFAGLYTNALAAMAYMHQGDVDRAETIFRFYQKHFEGQFHKDSHGGFPQFANAGNGQLELQTDRWIGDNAWLLIALNAYHKKTGKTEFDAMRAGIAKWLINLQDAGGGIRAGFNKDGPMNHYSTEGNLDCYAALVDYPEPRQKLKHFLETDMYVAADKRFRTGSTVDESALDTCAWAIASLGPKYATTFAYTEKKYLRTDTSEVNGNRITAFADVLDKNRIWLEGSGEMAVAYNVAGRTEDADRTIAEMEKALLKSVQWPELVGLPCVTSDPGWKGASTMTFVPSQAWYLFAKWRYNPMETDR